jgi:hypothetical protein
MLLALGDGNRAFYDLTLVQFYRFKQVQQGLIEKNNSESVLWMLTT